jgi:hypothetical protein
MESQIVLGQIYLNLKPLPNISHIQLCLTILRLTVVCSCGAKYGPNLQQQSVRHNFQQQSFGHGFSFGVSSDCSYSSLSTMRY